MKEHRTEFTVATMCRVLGVHRSGFYAWLRNSVLRRSAETRRLLEQIIHFRNDSDPVYDSPRILVDLRENGESCGKNRVADLMRENGISATAKRRRHGGRYAKPDHAATNVLDRQFDYQEINAAWTTDITYIRGKAGST